MIVPVYNGEAFIEKCLAMIREQTYTDYEVIIVENGSSDNTLNILEGYKGDPKIKIISSSVKGLGNACNVGLKNARGDYITFIDVDDYIYPNYLEELAKYKQYKIVKTAIENVSNSFNLQTKEYPRVDAYKVLPSRWGTLYHKDVFNGLSFENKFYEDFRAFPYIFDKCDEFYYIDKKLYRYNDGGDLTTNNYEYCLDEIYEKFFASKFIHDDIKYVLTGQFIRMFWAREYFALKNNQLDYLLRVRNTVLGKLPKIDVVIKTGTFDEKTKQIMQNFHDIHVN